MNNSCRLCLTKHSNEFLSNVFTCKIKGSDDSLLNILYWIFAVEIDVADPHSKKICTDCINVIACVMDIRAKMQQNQIALLQVSQCHQLESETRRDPHTDDLQQDMVVCKDDTLQEYSIKKPKSLKVSISEKMFPIVELQRLEETAEFSQFTKLRNGTFKKNKCRQLRLNKNLLNDICNTVAITKSVKNASVNSNLIGTNKAKERVQSETESMLNNAKKLNLNLRSKSDFCTPTEFDLSNSDELEKHPSINPCRQTSKKKKEVKVCVDVLTQLCPKVWLESFPYSLKRSKLKQIGEFSFIKERKKLQQGNKLNKYGSYLEYYNNFQSLAVRELIMGKNIRENPSTTKSCSFVKVSNVLNVFQCDFCSESFMSQTKLDKHQMKMHQFVDLTTESSNKLKTINRFISKKINSSCSDELSNTDDELSNNCEKTRRESIEDCSDLNEMNYEKGDRKREWPENSEIENDLFNTSYIWNKKKLGPYSAINFFQRNTLEHKPLEFVNKATMLNKTIQKLTNRLEPSINPVM